MSCHLSKKKCHQKKLIRTRNVNFCKTITKLENKKFRGLKFEGTF